MGNIQTISGENCPCCGADCCGPLDGCCFSEDSTVDFSVSYNSGSGPTCPTSDSQTKSGIPFNLCNVSGTNYAEWSDTSGTETWRVRRYDQASSQWEIYYENSSTGCFFTVILSDVDGEVNCCGTEGTITIDYVNHSFSSIDDTTVAEVPASASLTVNNNTCCNDGGSCVSGDDVNCNGFCDSNDPCSDCDPNAVGGSNPNSAVISNGSNNANCADVNAPATFVAFADETDYCEWSFTNTNNQSGSVDSLLIRYYKNSVTWNYSSCSLSMASGEWAIGMEFRDSLDAGYFYLEKTGGFACDSGKISGVHTFTATCADDGAANCSQTPTITVDP